MKIFLKNFRCYTETVFDLGDSGIVLISAPSGKGKTTILMAIQFVLFGIGKKITTYDKTSCSVRLELENIVITRTRTPNRLVLKNPDGIFEGDSAQSIINKLFGEHFTLTSCVLQNANDSFILMSPMDKLEFLEKFAFQDVDISAVNKKCKDIIKEKDTQLIKISSQLSTLNSIVEHIKAPETVSFPLKCSLKNRPTAIKNEHTKVKNTECLLKKHAIELNTLTEKYHSAKLREQKIELKKEHLKDIQTKIQTIEPLVDEIKIQTLESTLKKIENGKIYLEYKKRISAIQELKNNVWLKQTREETEDTMKDHKTIFEQLDKIKILTDLLSIEDESFTDLDIKLETYTVLLQEQKQKLLDIERTKDVYTCPRCSSFVKFSENILVVAENIKDLCLDTNLIEIKSDIKKTEHALKKIEHRVIIRRNNQETRAKIQSIYESSEYELKDLTYQDFYSDMKDTKKYYYENIDLDKKIQELERVSEKHKLAEQYECSEEYILKETRVLQDIKTFNELRYTLDFLLKDSKKILNDLKTLEDENITSENAENLLKQIDDTTLQISKFELQKKACDENIKKIDDYLFYESQKKVYDENLKKIEDSKEQEKIAVKELSSAVVLKELVLEAESISVMNIIASINIHAQVFLDAFFDDPISIRLVPFKETKSGKKPQINLDIHYKGMEADLGMLSGGELSRVVLAFMLALVEIFNSPLVLLDECTSSLDEDLNTDVIETIKNAFPKKLIVMISHQCVAGNYDKVIEL